MFLCSDTTQTHGLFLLAKVQQCVYMLVCISVIVCCVFVYRLVRQFLQLLDVRCDEGVQVS